MGKFKDEIDKMTFSFSRVHGFEGCQYEWYLNYLFRDEDGARIYEPEQNFYAAFGKFCHEILERIFLGELMPDDALEYYKEHYCEIDETEMAETTAEKYFNLGAEYFEKLSLDWLKDYEKLGVEKECKFTLGGRKFTGFIDLLLRHKETGDIIVVDHKSAEYPLGKKGQVLKSKAENYESYKRQLYLYSKQVFDEYGKYPSELWWNYFKDQKWLKLPFVEEEFKAATQWANEIVDKIADEEDFLPHKEYFYCENLCAFRNSCDYKDEVD